MTASEHRAHEASTRFVNSYGRAWESWDVVAFLELFSEDVLYVAHPTAEAISGLVALETYFHKEAAEQGAVEVRMGKPVIAADRVAAEFWVTAKSPDGDVTIPGCLIALLDETGRCHLFREYWFDVAGHVEPFPRWNE